MKLQDLLPLGTRVKMSAKGKGSYFDHSKNPHDGEGIIANYNHLDRLHDDEKHFYKVKWNNGQKNTYRTYDVDLIALPKVKCVEVPESFVREAYKAACADWKKKLDTQFPELELNPIVFFALGSKFKIGEGVYTLVKTGRPSEVTLIDPECGQAYSMPFTVFMLSKITKEEMNQVTVDFECIKNTYKK